MEPVIFFAAATSSTCYMFMRMLEAVEISHLFNVLGTTAFFLMCVCGEAWSVQVFYFPENHNFRTSMQVTSHYL